MLRAELILDAQGEKYEVTSGHSKVSPGIILRYRQSFTRKHLIMEVWRYFRAGVGFNLPQERLLSV